MSREFGSREDSKGSRGLILMVLRGIMSTASGNFFISHPQLMWLQSTQAEDEEIQCH